MIFGPYPATVVSVHDGDTCTLAIDLGWQITLRYNIRVYGINAPELSTDAGKAARDYAVTLLPVGAPVTLLSHGWDKYGGRADGVITLSDGSDLATRMIGSDNAKPYFGTGPKP